MKSAAISSGILLSTVLWLAVWTSAAPFDKVNSELDRAFGALPPWSKVTRLYHNPDTQEVSDGAHPLSSFQRLSRYWENSRRLLFIGNSQMQMVSLAADEPPSAAPEKTWVDLVADNLAASGENLKPYRLSAAGMTYAEALWYLLYMTTHPELTPDAVFLQANYQSMWNNGIRDGMAELLQDPAFRAVITREAARHAAYSGLFGEILQTAGTHSVAPESSSQQTTSPAANLETAMRRTLTSWSGYRDRFEERDAFLELLYRVRIYFLHLEPSTARSIPSSRLLESHSAIDRIATLCREHQIRLSLIRVPTNPQISLYRTPADRTAYVAYLDNLARAPGVHVYDLEDLVPARNWGMWYNGPDPLHMSRTGHHLLASRMTGIVLDQMRSHP